MRVRQDEGRLLTTLKVISIAKPGYTNRWGGLSTVYLLFKVSCVVYGKLYFPFIKAADPNELINV